MPSVHTIKTTKYFSVTPELSYSEYNTFEQVLTTDHKFIIRQKIGYNPYTASNGDTWGNYASTLELLAENEDVLAFIEENDWKFALSHFGMTSGYSYTDMWIKYTDKFGFSNSDEKFDISIDGFIKSYKRFCQLKQYDGYKYAKIAIENLILKEKISELDVKINIIEKENSNLKNLLSSLS